jgi:hypothetical protein
MRIHAIRKMPLSIDEAGSRCTERIAESSKRFRGKFRLFIENLQETEKPRKKKITKAKQSK